VGGEGDGAGTRGPKKGQNVPFFYGKKGKATGRRRKPLLNA